MSTPAPTPETVDVSICICTRKRPALLNALLEGLQAQRTANLRLQVVVVDNDPGASASSILHDWQHRLRFPLTCLHVPQPNIALARNTGVSFAQGKWVAFIDDDERPEPDWIPVLLETCIEFDADIAFGPVLPMLPPEAPAWASSGRFFERARHDTGTIATLDDARTGNALVRAALLARVRGPFDPAFGQSGGSDSVLFHRLAADGARMVWADAAIVYEKIPRERVTLRWLLQRAFRNGQVALRTDLLRAGQNTHAGMRLVAAARSLVVAPAWLVIAALSSPFSRIASIRALRRAAFQCGMLLGSLGHRYLEYRD